MTFPRFFVYFQEKEIANLLSKSIYLFKMSKHQAIFTFLRHRVAKSARRQCYCRDSTRSIKLSDVK